MELWRKTLGEQYPNYCSCLNNLAELYQATEKEGQRIAATLGARRLWRRDAALAAVRSPRILHLATHGYFLADRPNVD